MSVPHSHFRVPNKLTSAKTIKPVNFICTVTTAKQVTLIGDFNDWHPEATPMKRHVDGSWSVQLTLPHGDHHYQFLVDGKPTLDPRAQGIARNEQNEKVSLLLVS